MSPALGQAPCTTLVRDKSGFFSKPPLQLHGVLKGQARSEKGSACSAAQPSRSPRPTELSVAGRGVMRNKSTVLWVSSGAIPSHRAASCVG